jgi:flagellar basal body-associated protein FliL
LNFDKRKYIILMYMNGRLKKRIVTGGIIMKRIFVLVMAVAIIATMGVASASAIFAEKDASGNWVWSYDASELEYPVTKYATDYEGKMGTLHFTNYEYALQRIDLVNPADGISFGTTTDANNQGAYDFDIKIYKYDTSLDNSLNGEVLYEGKSPVAYSSWRTSYKFDKTLQPGSYVVEITSDAQFVNCACVAISTPVEGHSAEVYLSEGIQGDIGHIKNGGYILSYRTFLDKDYVPVEETEAPADVTEAPTATPEPTATPAPEKKPEATKAPEATPAPEVQETDAEPILTSKSAIIGITVTAGVAVLALVGGILFTKKKKSSEEVKAEEPKQEEAATEEQKTEE